MRLHTYQAKSLDDIWLDDIPNIRNPAAAVQDLEYTARPERRIQEWDLPDGYSVYVNKYRVFHRQFTWMAYRDVLNDVRRGNVVLLKRHDSGDEMARVVTSSGALRGDLPVALHTRLSYLIRNQLHRPRYITGTINSKAAGRLLAAGGIYNGNPDGFRNTARQLGGDAPAGYDQVMDNKGLFITGASVVAGLTMGRMQFPELATLERFGARGTYSGRDFDPELAGGPIENLTTEGVSITHEGIATVEKHISRFVDDPANDVMIGRLKKIANGEISPETVDLNYYTHECREYQRYCNLGWEYGEPEDAGAAYDLWNHAHTATLEDYRLKGNFEDLYHPDASDDY
ncbi:hypothetical protein [Mangrovibacter phragmitis]|uniref:hypothetical protein n=1 Tax=Mangrovibacter phragmitis TaxID=1691903 RepID=UPI003510E7CE